MAIRSNGYYNDPAFAQAASNLAAAFAPPSGGDAAGWANAAATKDKASALAEAFRQMTAPGAGQGVADRYGVGATVYGGGYAPTSSYFSVNKAAETSRANAALAARTQLQANEADNQRALSQSFLQPIGPNQVRNVPPGLAESFRVDPQQLGIVELDQGKEYLVPGQEGRVVGPAKPLSRAEVEGKLVLGLPPAAQDAVAFGNTPIEPIVTPEGPRNVSRLAAMGAEPYTAPAAGAKPTHALAQLSDGSRVAAVWGPNGRWQHAQTGQELPADVQIFDMPKPQGTAEEVGLGKTTKGEIEKRLIDITIARGTLNRLRELVQTTPGSQGLVGMVRGTAQDVIQAGGEIGKLFDGTAKELADGIAKGTIDAGLANQIYNPKLPAIKNLETLLPLQLAKISTGERLSNEMLRGVITSLGSGSWLGNQESTLARLREAEAGLKRQESVLTNAYQGGVGGLRAPPPAGDAQQQQQQQQQQQTAADLPVAATPEDAAKLPPGTRFRDAQGNVRTRP